MKEKIAAYRAKRQAQYEASLAAQAERARAERERLKKEKEYRTEIEQTDKLREEVRKKQREQSTIHKLAKGAADYMKSIDVKKESKSAFDKKKPKKKKDKKSKGKKGKGKKGKSKKSKGKNRSKGDYGSSRLNGNNEFFSGSIFG